MNKTFNASKAWFVVIISLLAQVAFAIGLMKAPATMGPIIEQFGISVTEAGNLMNANGVVALILALPAGMVMQKLGPRLVTIIALAVGICGNLIGLFIGAHDFGVLIASRAIEGFAYGLIVVTTPQFVSMWFPAQKRGLPNGVTSLWFSFGSLIILNLTGALMTVTGSWTGDWMFSAGFMVVILVLVLLFAKEPADENNFLEAEIPAETAGEKKPSIVDGLKSPATWLLLIVFFLFGYVNSAFSSYYPTYLSADLGLDVASANSITSIATAAMMVSGIVFGIVLNKVKVTKRPTILLVIAVLVGVCGLIMFNLPSVGMVIPFLIVFGLVLQTFPGTAYSVAPEAAASPATVAVTMGVMGIGQNFSGVFGTLITSLFVDNMGTWQSVTIPNAIFMVLGVVCAVALVRVMKKQYKKLGMLDEAEK